MGIAVNVFLKAANPTVPEQITM